MKAQRLRVFYAVTLPLDVRLRISGHIESLRTSCSNESVAWTKPSNLHITLKFIGNIKPDRLRILERAASFAALSVSPFTLLIEGTGAFPKTGQPRILWLGVGDTSGNLSRIYKVIEEECFNEGFLRDDRPFHAHVTIGRARAPREARGIVELHKRNDFKPVEFPVTELTTMKSEAGNSGSHYTEISRHPLANEPADDPP